MEPFIKINGRPFPYPKRGLELLTSTFVDSARNTAGQVVGQKVGRDQYKINRCEWPVLDAEQWGMMLSMLDDFFVDVTFPDPVHNTWRTLRMYPGDRSAEPYFLDETTGLPTLYRNCKVNLIDAGYEDTTPLPVPPQYKLQKKTVSPSYDMQSVKPDSPSYYGLSEVVVRPLAHSTVDTGLGDITSEDVIYGKIGFAKGVAIQGTMPNNGSSSKVIDGLTEMSYTVPKGFTSGGVVRISDDIETLLAKL